MQRWASLVVGAAVVALSCWLAIEPMTHPSLRPAVETRSEGGTTTLDSSAPMRDETDAAPRNTEISGLGLEDGGLPVSTLLADSGSLPSSAPRAVRLGVVLVQFVGAEGSPSSARAKPDAFRHAVELAAGARSDWKSAVKAGDSGSADDIGRVPRGVLDRATEAAVFSLQQGEVSDPLETPRGYWVVKRLE